MVDLPDVNVWVALSAVDHPFHKAAKNYFETQASDVLAFCRVTAMGFVHVTSHRHTFGGDPLSPPEAWKNYERWRKRDDVAFVAESPTVESILRDFVFEGQATPSNWTDLYLAAFAKARGSRLVTFDRGMRDLQGVNILLLEA